MMWKIVILRSILLLHKKPVFSQFIAKFDITLYTKSILEVMIMIELILGEKKNVYCKFDLYKIVSGSGKTS